MSGPVWKRLKMKGTCQVTGEESDELFAVGTVSDFVFFPTLVMGREAYERYKGHYDHLDLKALTEQKVPSVISRPEQV